MADDELDLRRVFDDLVRFETFLWNAIDERMQRDFEVSLGTVNVMMVIAATPLCRVVEISNAIGITVGGASQAVDRLEKAGLCARRANPEDRRSSVVGLTESGERLLAAATPVLDTELESAFRGPLSDPALGRTASALASLRSAIDPQR